MVATGEGLVRLNLASGQRPFPAPWVNMDIRDQGFQVDVIGDVRDLGIFDNESVDIIVAHHLLEHIALHEISDFIREWRRVLKIGGKLAICVPNLQALAGRWARGELSAYDFNVNAYGAYQGYEYDLHRWGYNEQELTDRVSGTSQGMEEFAWDNVHILQPQETFVGLYEGSNIAFDWWILCMEFTKNVYSGIYREKGDYRPWVAFIDETQGRRIIGKYNTEADAGRAHEAAIREEEENV